MKNDFFLDSLERKKHDLILEHDHGKDRGSKVTKDTFHETKGVHDSYRGTFTSWAVIRKVRE